MDGQIEIWKNTTINKDKCLLFDSIIFNSLKFIFIIMSLLLTHFIFKACITKMTLTDTISLGAIFATFGSAIVSVVILIENDKLNRVLLNVEILFTDLMHQEKWTRWPFIKRFSKIALLDGNNASKKLSNPQIHFNVGSHIIYIDIPTVKEDFYDLPSLKNYFKMFKYRKQFKTYIINNSKKVKNINFPDVGEYLLAWDCMYDIWKNVILFKVCRLIIIFGVSLIISSILYSFGFISISQLV